MTTKSNRLISFILGLLAVLYILTGTIFSLFNDVNIDLSKARYVVGPVAYADIRKIQNFTIRWTSYSRVFYFKLKNSNQDFAVRNSYEEYSDLESNISVGDTIKVYYGSTLVDDYNRHVFQIEKDGKILVDYAEYNERVSGKVGLGLFIGIVGLTVLIMWFKKFNIIKFLNRLVAP